MMYQVYLSTRTLVLVILNTTLHGSTSLSSHMRKLRLGRIGRGNMSTVTDMDRAVGLVQPHRVLSFVVIPSASGCLTPVLRQSLGKYDLFQM